VDLQRLERMRNRERKAKMERERYRRTVASVELGVMSAVLDLIRFRTTLKFALTTISGLVLAYPNIDLLAICLLLFTGFSTAFAFAINDVSDVEIDRLVKKVRNPIVTGKITRKRSLLLSSLFILVALLALSFLSFYNWLLGLGVIFIYSTYSFLVRAKAKPVLDVIYHSAGLSFFTLMGYVQYKPVDVNCLLLVSSVFLLSGMSEILQEVRDYESDRKVIKTTAILLGKRRALILGLVFFMMAFSMFLLSPLYGVVPCELLLLSPLAYFIVAPIIKTIRDETHLDKMIEKIDKRGPVIAGGLIVAFLLLKYFNLGFFV
jgi:4-hydroxybenzoate polyprenyltransferase